MLFAIFLSFRTMSTQDLFGVTIYGSFYKGAIPERSTGAEWIKSATIIRESDWNLSPWENRFLHPDGTLFDLYTNSFFTIDYAVYKGPPPHSPQQPSLWAWLNSATCVCVVSGYVSVPFFDPDGKLYFVKDDRLCTMLSNSVKSSQCTYTEVATSGWFSFKFLFFNPDGILYGVEKMASFIRGVHPQLQMTTGWLRPHSIELLDGAIFSSSFSCRVVSCMASVKICSTRVHPHLRVLMLISGSLPRHSLVKVAGASL